MPEVQVATALSAAEKAQLAACETVIARGINAFNDVGNALMRVRDGRLYRERFRTFEDYCEQQWRLTKARANQLVAATAVAELISTTMVSEINERQARELAPLLDDPEELREVYGEAVARTEGKPTAAAIRAVREEREQPPAVTPIRPPAPPTPTPAAETRRTVADAMDQHLGPDPDAPRRQIQADFLDAVKALAKARRFDIADLADALDDDAIRQLDLEIDLLAQYRHDIGAARREPGKVLFMVPKAANQ